MKLRLSGPELRKISDAIINTYGGSPNALALLDRAVTSYFPNRTVYTYITVASPFALQVADLLVAANGQGWLPGLIGALQQDQPDSEELQDVLRDSLSTASARQVQDFVAGSGNLTAKVQVELQRILPGKGTTLNLQALNRRLRSICRIDYADLNPPGVGTGFLVGPDLVLTNWHVVERVERAPAAAKRRLAGELRFRFDLIDRAAAEDAGGRASSANLTNESPVLRSSPAGGIEIPGGQGEPGMNELDYALIRLAEKVGNDPVPGAMPGEIRGHIQLRDSMPQPVTDDALMVLQHPMRGELQFAIGTVLGPNQTGSRTRHTAATQQGSSGSLVLDAYLAPTALHNGTHFGTKLEQQPYNTAVPLSHIVSDLKNGGITEMLQE
ncbi:serine protease [Mesorhizobium sp. M0833]|uniref:trypsin-like peptidase domain-containing protein n=1 Tax=Mesorhizobium sp. M0833 TaxID=2957009 RepID=UPI00333AE1C9